MHLKRLWGGFQVCLRLAARPLLVIIISYHYRRKQSTTIDTLFFPAEHLFYTGYQYLGSTSAQTMKINTTQTIKYQILHHHWLCTILLHKLTNVEMHTILTTITTINNKNIIYLYLIGGILEALLFILPFFIRKQKKINLS